MNEDEEFEDLERRLALGAAYLAGFNASGEGYNAEHPFRDYSAHPVQDAGWCKRRDEYIQEALAEQPAPSSHLTDEQKAANGLAWLARLEAMREEFAGLAEQPAQEPCIKCKGLGYYDEGHECDDGSMAGGNYVECDKCKQPDFIKHEVENAYDWSEWVCPDPESYLMKCCDCGLVHEAQFRVAKYKPAPSDECEVVSDPDLQAQFRMRRSEQWSPADTAHRPGGLPMAEQPAQEPVAYMNQNGVVHPADYEWEGVGNILTPLYTSPPYEATPLANANAGQRSVKPWVGLNDDDLDGYTKSNVLMVRHFERVLFERNTQPCLEGLPEPIRTPPEKGTEYWTIGLGRWTWGGTTHDYSSLGNGIWRCETDVWEVHAAIRRALGIESNIAAVFQNRHEAKLRERNEHREKNA